jgi:hypothetical protein
LTSDRHLKPARPVPSDRYDLHQQTNQQAASNRAWHDFRELDQADRE